MKKRILHLSLIMALLLVILPNISNAQKEITIIVNGKVIETDVKPYTEKGRTMVPVRFITEALGGDIEYVPAGEMYPIESVIIEAPGDELWLALFPNHSIALVSEGAFKSEVEPSVVNGRTMVPLRFIADYFGLITEWNENTWTINIKSGNSDNNDFYIKYWNDKAVNDLGELLLLEREITANEFSKAVK